MTQYPHVITGGSTQFSAAGAKPLKRSPKPRRKPSKAMQRWAAHIKISGSSIQRNVGLRRSHDEGIRAALYSPSTIGSKRTCLTELNYFAGVIKRLPIIFARRTRNPCAEIKNHAPPPAATTLQTDFDIILNAQLPLLSPSDYC